LSKCDRFTNRPGEPVTETLSNSGFIVVMQGEGGWDVPAQVLHPGGEPAEALRARGNYRARAGARRPCYQIAFAVLVPSADQIREWLTARSWRELPALADPGLTVWQAADGGLIRLPGDGDAASTMAAVESIATAAAMLPAELAREMTEIPARL
jgi:hypothetical protein